MSPSPYCRGCAGTGIDHSLSPREVQILTTRHYCQKVRKGYSSAQAAPEAQVQVVATQERVRLGRYGPVTDVIEGIKHFQSLGYSEPPGLTLAMLEAARCSWCGGTGVPSLSVHTLRAATS